MEKILVISDTHGEKNIINTLIKRHRKDIKNVIHLGDHSKDIVDYIDKYPEMKFYRVLGNCDFKDNAPMHYLLDINDNKIFMTHGSDYNVKTTYDNLYYKTLEKKANICLFGHTHVPVIINMDGVVIMNPGSPAYPRSLDGPSYGIIEIDNLGKAKFKVISIKDNKYKNLLEF